MKKSKSILTITGPSCAGKTTLLKNLIKEYPDFFAIFASETSRTPRSSDLPGEYVYKTEKEMEVSITNGEYLQSVSFNDVLYGTRQEQLEELFDNGFVPIRIVEPSGVLQFSRIASYYDANLFSVYVNASDVQIMERWMHRVLQNPENIKTFAERASKMNEELLWVGRMEYDYYYDERMRAGRQMMYDIYRMCHGNMNRKFLKKVSPEVFQD